MTIIEKFEQTVLKHKNKIAFIEDTRTVTFKEVKENSQKIGTFLLQDEIEINNVIGIFTKRSIKTIECMLGIMYAGCAYVVLDPDSPSERINKIINTVGLKYIIHDEALSEDDSNTFKKEFEIITINYNQIIQTPVLDFLIKRRTEKIISTNPAYILFTSGSTGIPKGTVVSHKNVITYIDWVSKEFKFKSQTIFGSQTPFYFSMSVTDIFSTLFCGCSFYIIPKSYFSFPIKLVEALNKYKVNTIYWVPSAYAIVMNLKVLDYVKIETLKLGLFAGEVMPTKVLNYWRDHLPKVKYANLFGPTETTDICTFYKVNRRFKLDEVIPIGKACHNLDVMLINEKGELASNDEIGELYCRGDFVAMGYYNNPEKTTEAFVQNPLNKNYPEIVYRTGDLCKYNKYGELIYISRKDFQIKHSGYRIELGEIEAAVNSIEKIKNAFCLYNSKEDKIVLVYEGKITDSELQTMLQKKLPHYMIPNVFEQIKQIKYNQNGKIDRAYYKEILINKGVN